MPIKFGGCPNCGRADCVALLCIRPIKSINSKADTPQIACTIQPVFVGWVSPKELEKLQSDGGLCAMLWNDQLEPTMIPLYTLPTQK